MHEAQLLFRFAKLKVQAPTGSSKVSKGKIWHEDQSFGFLSGFHSLSIEQPLQTEPTGPRLGAQWGPVFLLLAQSLSVDKLDVWGCFCVFIGRSLILCRSGKCLGWPGDLAPGPQGSIPGPGRGCSEGVPGCRFYCSTSPWNQTSSASVLRPCFVRVSLSSPGRRLKGCCRSTLLLRVQAILTLLTCSSLEPLKKVADTIC